MSRTDLNALIPAPQRVEVGDGPGVKTPLTTSRDSSLPAQGYRLDVGPSGAALAAADDAGEFYGRATLAQLPEDASVVVEDWPDIAVRGVMLDISRDKVPTMATLRTVVDRLASWKVNNLQLYIEHTFAYAGHEEVWRDASPITPDEFTELERLCRERHIELTVNQNCLGHMERWLKHESYRPLAYSPDGFDQHGSHMGPSTIHPAKDEAFALVAGLLEQIVPLSPSARVHVGLDEPWELLREPDLYMSYLRRLRSLDALDGKEMLVWGDVLRDHPALVDDIPDGVTICEWDYTAGYGWQERVGPMAERGIPFWVCPGTSSWVTLVGNVVNGAVNCAEAARAAVATGAAGYLVTNWGDGGHLDPFSASETALAYAASVAWCVNANEHRPLAALASAVFDDPTGAVGEAIMLLSAAHPDPLATRTRLAEPLYRRLLPPDRRYTSFRAPWVEACLETLRAGAARLASSSPRRADGDLVKAELGNAAAMLDLLGRHVLELVRTGTSPEGEAAAAMAPEARELAARHRSLWLERNRPGGLDDSARWLELLADSYDSPAERAAPAASP